MRERRLCVVIEISQNRRSQIEEEEKYQKTKRQKTKQKNKPTPLQKITCTDVRSKTKSLSYARHTVGE